MLALAVRNVLLLHLVLPVWVVKGRAECAEAKPTNSVLIPVQRKLETIKAVVLFLVPIFCLRKTWGLPTPPSTTWFLGLKLGS